MDDRIEPNDGSTCEASVAFDPRAGVWTRVDSRSGLPAPNVGIRDCDCSRSSRAGGRGVAQTRCPTRSLWRTCAQGTAHLRMRTRAEVGGRQEARTPDLRVASERWERPYLVKRP